MNDLVKNIVKAAKAKANSIITHLIQNGKIVFTVKDAGSFTFDPDKVSAENRARAMMHGFVQRISDGGALSRNPETGKPATPADKLARMQRIADHYMSGTTVWKLDAVAPVAKVDSIELILTGIMRGLGKTDAEAQAMLAWAMKSRNLDERGAADFWAATKQVAKAILDIKAEQAAATKDDASALLDEMMAEQDSEEDPDAEGEGGGEDGED